MSAGDASQSAHQPLENSKETNFARLRLLGGHIRPGGEEASNDKREGPTETPGSRSSVACHHPWEWNTDFLCI